MGERAQAPFTVHGPTTVKDGGGGGGGGGEAGTTLEAKSTGNHCGGTPLLSDWRAAWAAELGLDEINGSMVLVPARTRPCQLERGEVSGWRSI